MTQATQEWTEGRNASDHDAEVDLHYGPFDDSLGVSVSRKVGYRLDPDALNNGYEKPKAIQQS